MNTLATVLFFGIVAVIVYSLFKKQFRVYWLHWRIQRKFKHIKEVLDQCPDQEAVQQIRDRLRDLEQHISKKVKT